MGILSTPALVSSFNPVLFVHQNRWDESAESGPAVAQFFIFALVAEPVVWHGLADQNLCHHVRPGGYRAGYSGSPTLPDQLAYRLDLPRVGLGLRGLDLS